ncbi:MAG: tRNA(adenine34) deaminase [Kiritimatiellia bacterium]|jgi:tRNA(adenine34) deaminase
MSTASHQHFMQAALAEAELARAKGDVPVGAVIVKDGEIIGRGHNLREVDQDPTAHAEMIAIRQAARQLASWRLEGCTVYVTLEPCAMCSGAMVLSRIESCVYGAYDPKGGFLGTLADLSDFDGLNHRFEVVGGVEEETCAEQLRSFFRELRKKKKRLRS